MSSAEKDDYAAAGYQNMQPGGAFYGGGSLGGDDVEEADEEDLEDQDEQLDELDERNDVYTAKGNGLPPAVTQSVQSLRGRDNFSDQQMRPMASSATATSSANAYHFKMTPGATGKRNPSLNSDKSHSSSVKSNYSNGHQHPYQRVLTSLSTGTKKKVKVGTTGPSNVDPSSTTSGNKLYEKIRSGMQATLGSTVKQPTSHQYPTTNGATTTTAANKKKPSTIFTFNK